MKYIDPPIGYIDLRILHDIEETGVVTQEMLIHLQSVINSGTIYQTQHWVVSLCRDLASVGALIAPDLIEHGDIPLDVNGVPIKVIYSSAIH